MVHPGLQKPPDMKLQNKLSVQNFGETRGGGTSLRDEKLEDILEIED